MLVVQRINEVMKEHNNINQYYLNTMLDQLFLLVRVTKHICKYRMKKKTSVILHKP